MTPLDSPLKRQLDIAGRAYTLLLTPDALRLTEKGKRNGIELSWRELVSGDAALAAALRGSLQR